MPRLTFERELASLRETVVRMGTLVESQIEASLDALRRRDGPAAEKVRSQDQYLNELFKQIREQIFMVIATQQPVARDLRRLMGIQYIATELERMGDYAVRIGRMTKTLVGLPDKPLRAEFGLMGDLAIGQVHDILEALIDENEAHAREVAGRDNEIDRLYHRVFDELISEMGTGKNDSDGALRAVTLLLVAHNLERIADRVTNVAEDIVFLETGQVVELGGAAARPRATPAACWSWRTTKASARCSSTTSPSPGSRCRRPATERPDCEPRARRNPI